MHNSKIKRKKCKCSPNCEKYPSLGYKGYFSGHLPKEIKDANPERFRKSHIAHLKRANLANLSRKVHSYQQEKNKSNNELKSALLKKADDLFSKFIKKRDSDEKGNVKCPCCDLTYNLKDKTPSGDYIVQALHFVSRKVYSLRYDERQVKAGCCYCNKDMFDFPLGIAYKKFRETLYLELGMGTVWMMEAEKRNINKLSHNDLEDIIKKYSITKK